MGGWQIVVVCKVSNVSKVSTCPYLDLQASYTNVLSPASEALIQLSTSKHHSSSADKVKATSHLNDQLRYADEQDKASSNGESTVMTHLCKHRVSSYGL